MKKISIVFLLMLSMMISACSDTQKSKSEYMIQHVSTWNGTVSEMNRFTQGSDGIGFNNAIEQNKSTAKYSVAIGRLLAAQEKRVADMEKYPYPKNAAELNAQLVDFLKTTVKIYAGMLKITALPANANNNEIAILAKQQSTLEEELQTKLKALNTIQRKYASENGIKLMLEKGFGK
jgi:hypothetical protein